MGNKSEQDGKSPGIQHSLNSSIQSACKAPDSRCGLDQKRVMEVRGVHSGARGGGRGGENSDNRRHGAELQEGQLFCTISYYLVLQVPQRFELSLVWCLCWAQPSDQVLRAAGMTRSHGGWHRRGWKFAEGMEVWNLTPPEECDLGGAAAAAAVAEKVRWLWCVWGDWLIDCFLLVVFIQCVFFLFRFFASDLKLSGTLIISNDFFCSLTFILAFFFFLSFFFGCWGLGVFVDLGEMEINMDKSWIWNYYNLFS